MIFWLALGGLSAVQAAEGEDGYEALMLADDPVAYWRFGESEGADTIAEVRGRAGLAGHVHGDVKLAEPGPRPDVEDQAYGFTAFEPTNRAAVFDGSGSRIVIDDAEQALRFEHGDAITIEAWVKPDQVRSGQHMYVIGKGRTHNEGYPRDNQNWALRVAGAEEDVRVNFLFRSTDGAGRGTGWHRWTSDRGFSQGRWHHIAVTYTFGKAESLAVYVDGEAVEGTWDMDGPTDRGPVTDDDEVWIGSSMGGSGNFRGALDELAVYRTALSAERIAARHQYVPRPSVPPGEAPSDAVLVEILEDIEDRSWDFPRPAPVRSYRQEVMAFVDLPHKYNERGLILDRTAPYMIRAVTRVHLPEGEYRLLLRSLSGARLYMDGELLASTRFSPRGNHGHHPVEPLPVTEAPAMPDIRHAPGGHAEAMVEIVSEGGEHVFKLEAAIGGASSQRLDVGELAVAMADERGRFHLLAPSAEKRIPLTDAAWEAYARDHRAFIRRVNDERRLELTEAERAYWQRRHALVREALEAEPLPFTPSVSDSSVEHNEIDFFINRRLEQEGIEPAPLVDDYGFLRRATLDTVGVVPTPEEIEAFFADPPETRRGKAIDRLLADPRWADHWVAYWQDVLGENPTLIHNRMNNTGPFRWYIHEAMRENRSIDRFVTELAMMEGSEWHGGPAGFGIATENDVPMADKAHTLSKAFLGKNLSCARCHDAPFRDFEQEEVFAMAAMLGRGAQSVPETSSVPVSEEELRRMIVEVTLPPGSTVEPRWPFEQLLSADIEQLPELFVRDTDDTRAEFAALLTWHRNERFAPVVVNRVWERYLGFALLEPVDDWFDGEVSHPQLLAYLSRRFKLSGYDLKELARLILNSHTYQRAIVAEKSEPVDQFMHLFASPMPRRLSAEQVVDSLFAVADKPFRTGPLTVDPHSNHGPSQRFNNLGVPERAWQFASLANERDRPSLNLPMAQRIIEVLTTFGWRDDRADPRTRDQRRLDVQQPAILANGVVGRRITRLSDDSAFTEMALVAEGPEQFVEALFLRILSREPDEQELTYFSEIVAEGFAERVVSEPPPLELPQTYRRKATWRNHLEPEANDYVLKIERKVEQGEPASVRLEPEWRERAEDVVWSLVNAPEFVLIP